MGADVPVTQVLGSAASLKSNFPSLSSSLKAGRGEMETMCPSEPSEQPSLVDKEGDSSKSGH